MLDLLIMAGLFISFVDPEEFSGHPVYHSGVRDFHKQDMGPGSKFPNVILTTNTYDDYNRLIKPGFYQVKYVESTNELRLVDGPNVVGQVKVSKITKLDKKAKIPKSQAKIISQDKILLEFRLEDVKVYAVLRY